MSSDITGPSGLNAKQIRDLEEATLEEINQVASEEDFQEWTEQEAFNPLVMLRRFQNLNEIKSPHAEKAEQQKVEQKKILEVEKTEEAATRFQNNNPELQSRTLIILRSRILASDSPEEVLRKVLEVYADHSLADEAFDFLIETADPSTLELLRLAKELLNTRFAREVKAGRNMGAEAREFSKEGLGSATSLRDLYRDITGTQRDPVRLFSELSDKFPYAKLRTTIRFLLHSLGADLRAKGPSIEPALLRRLLTETRSLQGILGVYRFFQERMNLIRTQFNSYQVALPLRLNFEILARQFVRFLAERVITPPMILQSARNLGIGEEAIAQMIIFNQMRDAIKQVAPRYYRSNQHREELLKAFLKVLEEIEDKLEKETEEEEKKEREKRKKKDS